MGEREDGCCIGVLQRSEGVKLLRSSWRRALDGCRCLQRSQGGDEDRQILGEDNRFDRFLMRTTDSEESSQRSPGEQAGRLQDHRAAASEGFAAGV